MQSGAVQTFTVIGLRSDVDMTDLFIAGVIPGPVAEEFEILETSEEEFTRWAMEFDAHDANAAAARAYVHCRTGDENEETAGALLQAVLADVSIRSRRGGDISAGAFWISVPVNAHTYIAITGTGGRENEIDYEPAEHQGWYVELDSDAAAAPAPTVLHATGCPDFQADTAAVVETIRRFLTRARRARKDQPHVPGDH